MRAARRPHLLALAWCALTSLALLLAGTRPAPASAATEPLYIPQTGQYVQGVFRDFWDRNGGLANFGYPITQEYIDPATGRVFQYFERARFERATPAAAAVQLGLVGREALGERTFPRQRPIQNSATRRYFAETGYIVQFGFKQIWETRGGLAVFGLPLSPEIREATDDGVTRTVQYFERARFEFHPDQPDGRRVLISALGRRFAPPGLTSPLAPGAPPAAPLVIATPTAAPAPPAPPAAAPPAPAAEPPAPEIVRPIVPAAVSATMAPIAGALGQTFTLGPRPIFAPRETVSVWATPNGGQAIFIGRFEANREGSIAPVSFTPSGGAPLGDWSIVAQGNDSQRQAIGYFVLLGGPIGRAGQAPPAQPTPTPGPPVPANQDARVEPASGPAGTIFFLDARGFRPGESVQVAIIASNGTQTGASPVTADQAGSIRYAGLFFPTQPSAPLGLYRMVAFGTTSNKTSTAYFVLTP